MKTYLTLLIITVLAALHPETHAATFVTGHVPDWNQPYWHGANGSNGGPALADVGWEAWCVPTSAANVLGHWNDSFGVTNTADNLPFPHSFIWGLIPLWQDYQANGHPLLRGAMSAFGDVDDLGWYMDTNQRGDPAHGNRSRHTGTRIPNISPGPLGLNKFFRDLTSSGRQDSALHFLAYTHGRNYADPQTSLLPDELAGFEELKAEIDKGRTAIAHFSHWNLDFGRLFPGTVSAIDDEETVTEAEFGFDFIPFSEPTHTNELGEIWDFEDLGHAVTVVGYVEFSDPSNPMPGVNWVIVHDNWQSTPRNVAVPMGSEWMANTVIVYRPWFYPPAMLDWNRLRLTLTNTLPGCKYVIEASTTITNPSPANWHPVALAAYPSQIATISVRKTIHKTATSMLHCVDYIRDVYDQGLNPNPPYVVDTISPIRHKAQTFRINQKGTLSRVEMLIRRRTGASSAKDLEFELRETINGVPTESTVPPLLAITIPPAIVPAEVCWISLDISSHEICVMPGRTLALVLLQNGTTGSDFDWLGDSSQVYPSGSLWNRNLTTMTTWTAATNQDLGFRTYIQLHGRPSLDDSFSPDPTNVIGTVTPQFHWAQTFTVRTNGLMSQVDVLIERLPSVTVARDLEFEIRNTAQGSPTASGPPLASRTVPAASVPIQPDWVNINFSAQEFCVEPGDVLAIVLKQSGNPTLSNYLWRGNNGNAYGSGALFTKDSLVSPLWIQTLGQDLGFRAYVRRPGEGIDVPEKYYKCREAQ